MDIYAFFAEHGIEYQRFDHPAVYTVEEAKRLVPPMPGAKTKNLFLRNRSGKRHFLVVIGYDKAADLKALTKTLGVSKLGFASPERLLRYLGVEPGAVSILGLLNDRGHAVEVVVDRAIWEAKAISAHPLVNTSTLVLSHEGLARFLEATGHQPRLLNVPAK
jgi:Ala-tRNA(Pro) deacylase